VSGRDNWKRWPNIAAQQSRIGRRECPEFVECRGRSAASAQASVRGSARARLSVGFAITVLSWRHRLAAMQRLGETTAPSRECDAVTTPADKLAVFLEIGRAAGLYRGQRRPQLPAGELAKVDSVIVSYLMEGVQWTLTHGIVARILRKWGSLTVQGAGFPSGKDHLITTTGSVLVANAS
jgi:hypothetical protein